MNWKQVFEGNESTKADAPETERGEEEMVAPEEQTSLQENAIEPSKEESSSDPDYASDLPDAEQKEGEHQIIASEQLEDFESVTTENEQFIVVADFEAQEKTDLSLKQGELLRIIATREDGWWLAENNRHNRGFVPKTFLKVYKEFKNETNKGAVLGKRPVPMPRNAVAETVKADANFRSARIEGAENEKGQGKAEITEQKSQRNEKNVAAIRNITEQAKSSSKRQETETKILEQSTSESSVVSGSDEQNIMRLESGTLKDIPGVRRDITYASRIWWPGTNISNGSHLTYECYLAPRLSESNLAFHDIYWNFEDDRLRKRRVRVSKLIKIIRLEKVHLNAIDVHSRLIRAYLLDRNVAQAGRQIVSNIYTIKANPRARDPETWIFAAANDRYKATLDYPSFIVRSNYKQKSVALCLEAIVVFTDQEGETEDRSLGCITLPIINESGHCCLQNKSYSIKLVMRDSRGLKGPVPVNNHISITFRVSNVPDSIVHQVDSLPDIILCNAQFVPMFFYYRRLLGQFLTKDSDNGNGAALRAEPFLASFPAVADQSDLMDMLWKLWQFRQKSTPNSKKLSEAEEAERYRSFFLTTAFVLHQTVPMPEFNWVDVRCMANRQAILNNFQKQYLHNFDVVKYLSRQKCRPINLFSYAVDTAGPHAIS